MAHPLGNTASEPPEQSPGPSFGPRLLRKASKAIPATARSVGRGLIAVPRAIARLVALRGRRRKQEPKGKEPSERGPDGDDISVVAATLMADKSTTVTSNYGVSVSDALLSVLRGEGDPIPDAYVQDLVDRIQHAMRKHEPQSPLDGVQASPKILLRVLLQIMEKTGRLPTQIFLPNVECTDRRTYGIGKGIDVFRGSVGEREVELKHLRVFRMVVPSQRLGLEKAFFREAVLWYNLSHEHILPFLGLVDIPELGGLCIVTPWMENGDVRRYLDNSVKEKGLSGQDFVDTVNRLLYEISLGMAYLHSEGVVHGELRGAHVYVNADAGVYLGNYGLTSITEVGSEHSASLQGGSGAWLAPELIDPERIDLPSSKSTQETDVYSFGCLCVELYARQSPFQGQTDFRIATRVLKGERPERPMIEGQEMSDALWSLVTWCWREAPSDRPSAPQIVDALDHILTGS